MNEPYRPWRTWKMWDSNGEEFSIEEVSDYGEGVNWKLRCGEKNVEFELPEELHHAFLVTMRESLDAREPEGEA